MSAEPEAQGKDTDGEVRNGAEPGNGRVTEPADTKNAGANEDEEEDEEDEPRLKYNKLTASIGNIYKGGDATSTFLVAGDKMILGTHNGNIHALNIPTFQSLRFYHSHSASVTSVSISPILPTPPPNSIPPVPPRAGTDPVTPAKSTASRSGPQPSPKSPRGQPAAPPPNIPSNQIYIASGSIDGHVCVSSLVDPSDVTLRNFARPIQAVALSPDYKTDRTYLSGGLAGNLIITVGGRTGVSADANTNSTAAAASGWLGSIGLGSNTGKDTIIHSGEGSISAIKFSRTSRFVVWINEQGVKIMRSHLKLDGSQTDIAWKRIGHVDRPGRGRWEEMASVWKGRVEWISDKQLEPDDDQTQPAANGSRPASSISTSTGRPERLVVGWGDTAWILHVHQGGMGTGKHAGERIAGSADILHKLTFDDCIISGLSLYTPSLLAVLAYRTRDDDDNPIGSAAPDTPRKGRHHRQNGLLPELRLINVKSGDETDVDTLKMSRFESLSAADYHLGTVYVPQPQQIQPAQKTALENLGHSFLDVGNNATRLFSSAASASSGTNSEDRLKPLASRSLSMRPSAQVPDANPAMASSGLKLIIHSPYDCVLAIKRDVGDRLEWLLERQKYALAWQMVDEHPEIASARSDRQSVPSSPSTPTPSRAQAQGSLADFFADDSTSQTTTSAGKAQDSAAAKEKLRIGDLWLQQLVNAEDWTTAGQVAGKVLGTSPRWEHWVLTFVQANRFDDITPYIPSTSTTHPLPSVVYEVVLGHYIDEDRPRFNELLEQWNPELFDITSVTTAVRNQLDAGDVTPESVEGGETGRDWRILMDGLAKLELAGGSPREALRCYIRLQNAEATMTLIRDWLLVDAITDDIPGLVMLRVSKQQLDAGNVDELDEASSEAINLLVDETRSGAVPPLSVVDQLESKGQQYQPFIYSYLSKLWRGPKVDEDRFIGKVERLNNERQVAEGRDVVERFADLAVSLFAEYKRADLMAFLRQSTAYTLDRASSICETRHYIPELVYLLSKTGQTRRALFLIIGELGDVSQAISFTKEHPDLWDDLLDYSMDKPPFIRALLSEVGTAIDPLQLIRRIPDGLEIEGLKEGVQRMVREYDIQYSISEGVTKVFRGEVSSGMDTLRAGQKRAVKFEVRHRRAKDVEVKVNPVASRLPQDVQNKVGLSRDKIVSRKEDRKVEPGHCMGCEDLFEDDETDFLVGFACGHVFHLSCLLDRLKLSTAEHRMVEDMQSQARAGDGGAGGGTRSIGAKISHAQIIRTAVKGGCPVCITAVGAE